MKDALYSTLSTVLILIVLDVILTGGSYVAKFRHALTDDHCCCQDQAQP